MSTVELSANESTIIAEYARIKGLDATVLLRKGVDSVVRDAITEQIKIDFAAKAIEADVVALFDERDYYRLALTTAVDTLPASILEHLKARPVETKA